jgi:excisionase family DNA binding protein
MTKTTLELLTTAEVAELAKVDPATVTRWVKAKTLPVAFKTTGLRGGFLFSPKAVEEFIAKRTSGKL